MSFGLDTDEGLDLADDDDDDAELDEEDDDDDTEEMIDFGLNVFLGC